MIDLVKTALAEDIGSGDVTTLATVPVDLAATALISQKEAGVIYGLSVAETVFQQLDETITCKRLCEEGQWREGGPVLSIEGSARAVLSGERTALNFLQHLSGIATFTATCVRQVEGTGVLLLDTRKTTPGLRQLEKAAVAAGGAQNHRVGLYDAFLIKENHIAAAGGIGSAVARAQAANPTLLLEIECRNREEIDEALEAKATRLLLDNFKPEELKSIVSEVAGQAELEASGGITLDNLADFAVTGVNFISMGALTHSAKALDLSLIIEAVR